MTHQGMVRGHNEDTVFADPVGLAVLADGMGGYSAGEVASGIAVRVLVEGMLPPVRSRRPMGKVDVASGLSHAGQLVLGRQIAFQVHFLSPAVAQLRRA